MDYCLKKKKTQADLSSHTRCDGEEIVQVDEGGEIDGSEVVVPSSIAWNGGICLGFDSQIGLEANVCVPDDDKMAEHRSDVECPWPRTDSETDAVDKWASTIGHSSVYIVHVSTKC